MGHSRPPGRGNGQGRDLSITVFHIDKSPCTFAQGSQMEPRANIHDVSDYITMSLTEAGEQLSLLKLQKLVYYVQAWHLAFFRVPLFAGKFQAWVHGPVNRELYDRYRNTKSLYSNITKADIRDPYVQSLDAGARGHIDSVLEVYGKYTGTQLEELTHREDPWIQARQWLPAAMPSTAEISEHVMRDYYAARLASNS